MAGYRYFGEESPSWVGDPVLDQNPEIIAHVDAKHARWPGLDNENPTVDVSFPHIDTLYAVTVSFFDPEEYGSVYFWREGLDLNIRHPAHDGRVCMHGPVEILRIGVWDSLHFVRWSPKVKGPHRFGIEITSIVKIIRHYLTIIFSMVKPQGIRLNVVYPLPDKHTPARFYVNCLPTTFPSVCYFFKDNFF